MQITKQCRNKRTRQKTRKNIKKLYFSRKKNTIRVQSRNTEHLATIRTRGKQNTFDRVLLFSYSFTYANTQNTFRFDRSFCSSRNASQSRVRQKRKRSRNNVLLRRVRVRVFYSFTLQVICLFSQSFVFEPRRSKKILKSILECFSLLDSRTFSVFWNIHLTEEVLLELVNMSRIIQKTTV